MADREYDTLRDWLRVKWIPGDPTGDDIVRFDDHLSLSPAEQLTAVREMSDDEAEFWMELETARALYVDPVDRESGITEAKVARYPERYGSGFKSDRTL
ncbi:hypothetical protein [Sinorhizobium medicae]|uniref:hypothetical protein n=1 Tax=Sinorhizobium medicae TaxID=110321 RepID=UPI000FDB5E31|nr:hypothetical protein [Sinorhizobium medicae]RVP48115.1 hypothetical protein CN078_25565 [Sinorhizobium medicae]RVP75402.1 hypothetical protein CN079_19885 [Sinorhizobium medicae]UWU06626.1 hypothetical protein N2598_09530 [Sinorhizobium medicae]